MVSRRDFLSTSLGAGAALTLTPALLRTFQQAGGSIIQRAIPSTGEMVPAISFSPRPEADNATMKALLKTLLDRGVKVVDVLHGGPAGEQAARQAAGELGIQDRFFWTTQLSVAIPVLPGAGQPKADPAAVKAAINEKLAAFKASKVDLVMLGVGGDLPTAVAALTEMKKEGRVRYIGVHALAPPPSVKTKSPLYNTMESIMRNEPIDFIGTDYNVGDRRLEEKILPLAQERKIGVMAYFTFDRGRFFQRAKGMAVPDWAAEFDAKTWAQFCLKFVLSHPAITIARTGTSDVAHLVDNIGGAIGRLPDEATRKRMTELVDTLPPTPAPVITDPKLIQILEAQKAPGIALSAAILDRYAGEYLHAAAGTIMTVRRDGDRLLVKIQGSPSPEGALVARSETRFSGPWPASIIEFQVDGQGKVTGAFFEVGAGGNRIVLERK